MTVEAGVLPGPGDRHADEAAGWILDRTDLEPAVALILGSGLGPAAELIMPEVTFPFTELAGFPEPTVPGHAGRLIVGRLREVPVAAFLGRIHFYEGHPMSVSALPVRVARLLGAEVMVLTAAVGALDRSLSPGTIVVADDHINLMGESPLRGWRNPDGSPPFVDVSALYDPALRDLTVEEARSAGIPVATGVYVAAAGPSYETRAETDFMRRAGGTVVGMSIVPEAVPARALGMRVLGLFSVTNLVGGEVSHEEVIAVGAAMGPKLADLLARIVPRLIGSA